MPLKLHSSVESLLDLSTTFDSSPWTVLLSTQTGLWNSGNGVEWFEFYHKGHSSSVSWQDKVSFVNFKTGVHQGSVLGSLLSSINASLLGKNICSDSVSNFGVITDGPFLMVVVMHCPMSESSYLAARSMLYNFYSPWVFLHGTIAHDTALHSSLSHQVAWRILNWHERTWVHSVFGVKIHFSFDF